MDNRFGFYRLAACVPECRVADVNFNCERILALASQAEASQASVVVFPELAVTSGSCGDLFSAQSLLAAATAGVEQLVWQLPQGPVFVIGAPVKWCGRLFNAAVVVQNQRIRGVVPKMSWGRPFASVREMNVETIDVCGFREVPWGADLIFDIGGELSVGIEIGEDAWGLRSRGASLALSGANMLLNPAMEVAMVGKAAYQRQRVVLQSGACVSAYAYVSAGVHESSTDGVCDGQTVIAEGGHLLAEKPRYMRNGQMTVVDVDVQLLQAERMRNSSFTRIDDSLEVSECRHVYCEETPVPDMLARPLARLPFVPEDADKCAAVCADVFEIQKAALAKRIEHVSAKKLVLGISGGLDSTLALMVCAESMKMLSRPQTDVIAVTMPGFGTSDRTYVNACNLCRQLGVELREISIKDACLEHFRNIGHDPAERNVVYENAQARERTQILLDLANKVGGLVVGTGDLSEGALGWCTFNGDHISQYGVNGDVPKTLMRSVIAWVGANVRPSVKDILQDVIDTPVSPELLPADEQGQIKQKTEDILGPYEVHDFFLYHFLKENAEPKKILYLAEQAFAGEIAPEKLKGFLRIFLRRFFTQQFKRNCMPDGPRVGTLCLSPRGAWQMPSDIVFKIWLDELNE